MVLLYMLTYSGYIDGIHGTPYIAAPWILWVMKMVIHLYSNPFEIYEFASWDDFSQYMGVSEKNPMVFMIIIPIKWLFHWEY